MNAFELLKKYRPKNERGWQLLKVHSEMVAMYSLEVAQRVPELSPDLSFIEEAALLHDIGIAFTHAPSIGCTGSHHYMQHGLLGARLLRKLGYPRHADVCERHIGVGLTSADIAAQNLPLPHVDIVPVTVEEQIIAYVDNFFSKGSPEPERPVQHDSVREKMAAFGNRCLSIFDEWTVKFGVIESQLLKGGTLLPAADFE